MKMRLHIPVAVSALAVLSMVAGFLAITAPAASASSPPAKWYVATTGTDTSNACTVKTFPCQTITHALAEQAASLVGGVIKVAAGTYTEQLSLTPANDNVKIAGAGPTTVIQPPASGLLSDTDTDSSQPQYYVIDVAPGTTRLVLSGLTVSGANASAFLDGDGQGCGQDYVGIYYHSASGSIKNVSVNGIDMPADLFGCQGGQGIYVNSAAPGSATVSMNGVSMLSPAPSTTTTADLPAGTYTNDQLAVTKVPAGITKLTTTKITVDGFVLDAKKDTSNVLFITGTTSADSPKGSPVRENPFTPAYDKNGITCDDQNTNCSITNSTVQGEGPTNQIAQNGIQDFGAGATTISGNTISGDSYAGGGEGNSASGILVLNAGTVSVDNNHVSASDVNIYAGEIAAFGLVAAPIGEWDIDGNTVSAATSTGASAGVGGYGEGIQLDSTANTVVVEGNTISTSAQSDLLLTGVSNAGIGAVGGGDTGNTITGSQAGIVVGGPGTACAITGSSCTPGQPAYGSSLDAFFNNIVSGDQAGVVVEGAYAPNQRGLNSNPGGAVQNNFSGNNWNSNQINVVDFSGFNNPGPPTDGLPPSAPILNQYGPSDPNSVPTNTADACEPTPGGSPALLFLSGGQPLYYSC
jgi:hypothetical protein